MLKYIVVASLIAAAVVGFTVRPASAQWTGNQLGNYQYWNNSRTGQSFSCNRLGNYTYCN